MTEQTQIVEHLLEIIKEPFKALTLEDVTTWSGGLVLTILIVILVLRILHLLENLFQRRGKPSRAKLFRIVRLPCACAAFFCGLLLLATLLNWGQQAQPIVTWIEFLFWICVAWGGIRALEYLLVVRLLYERHGVQMPRLFHDLILWVLYCIPLVLLVKTFFPNVNLTVLLTTSALLSVILGLALQDTLSNLFAGLALHFEGTLHMGQWIGIDKWEGEVAGITWRSIKLRTFEGDYVIIPNNVIAKAELINYSQPSPMHIQVLPIGVSYDCPPGKVKRVCLEVLGKVEGILQSPPCRVSLKEYGDFSINYDMRFWIGDYSQYRRIRDEVYSLLWYHFKREGIVIPFPIRTLDIPSRRERTSEAERLAELEQLRQIDFLGILGEEQLRTIQQNLRPLVFAAGEIIIRQNHPNRAFYMVETGEVEVSLQDSAGKKQVLSTIGKGGFFGESSLFTGEPATATVTALTDTRVASLDQSIFGRLIQSNPEVARLISKTISERAIKRAEALEQRIVAAAEVPEVPVSEEEAQDYANRFLQKMRRLFRLY